MGHGSGLDTASTQYEPRGQSTGVIVPCVQYFPAGQRGQLVALGVLDVSAYVPGRQGSCNHNIDTTQYKCVCKDLSRPLFKIT